GDLLVEQGGDRGAIAGLEVPGLRNVRVVPGAGSTGNEREGEHEDPHPRSLSRRVAAYRGVSGRVRLDASAGARWRSGGGLPYPHGMSTGQIRLKRRGHVLLM